MKANEMEAMSNEELISYLQQVHPWYADLAEADPVHEVHRRLRTLSALEAKIKGMIDRPTISIRVLEREAFSTRYLLRLNEFPIDGFYSLDSAEASGKLLTKALGMEGEEYD